MTQQENEPNVVITLKSLKLHSEIEKETSSVNDVTFTLDTSLTPASQITNLRQKNDAEDSEADEETKIQEDTGSHPSVSVDSLYARRKRSREKLDRIPKSSNPEEESQGSQSPPCVQYNVFLSNAKSNNMLEVPPTPSVADVVQLRYNLSPEIIREKSENEFNFVIPLPHSQMANKRGISTEANQLMDSVTPLKYHLSTICTIGKGSFGRVFLTRHRLTGKYYALKAMHIPAIISKKQVEHVHNEKNILQQLKHPFVVKLFDIAKDRKNLYMILEYVSGGELFSYLRTYKSFSSPVVKFYTAEVILALEYLHSLYIAYRDLKPENLMLTDEGHVKLTDFGFAKKFHNRTYTFCGTSEYLAPEVFQRKGHGHGVDHWALGVLVFELIAGHTPFRGEDADAVLESIQSQQPPNNIEFPRKTFSHNAKDLIRGLLTGNEKERLGQKSTEQIKQHAWFENCDWQAVYDKALKPPLVPTIYFEGDTGNFDSYDETEEIQPAQQRELDLFDDW